MDNQLQSSSDAMRAISISNSRLNPNRLMYERRIAEQLAFQKQQQPLQGKQQQQQQQQLPVRVQDNPQIQVPNMMMMMHIIEEDDDSNDENDVVVTHHPFVPPSSIEELHDDETAPSDSAAAGPDKSVPSEVQTDTTVETAADETPPAVVEKITLNQID